MKNKVMGPNRTLYGLIHRDASEPRISDDDVESSSAATLLHAQKSPIKSYSRYSLLSIACKIVIVLFSFWGFVDVGLRLWSRISPSLSTSGPLPCYCGTTRAEAESLGCKYVAMASAWLPERCRDPYLEADFEAAGPNGLWEYYADANMTKTLSKVEIADFAGTYNKYYNPWKWHVVHCLYYWRKLHRAQWSGVILEPRFNTDAHIHHCSKLILSGNRQGITTSGIDMGDGLVSRLVQQEPVPWNDLNDGTV